MSREKDIELYLRKQAKLHDVEVYKFTSPANRGVPDDIVVWPGGRLDFCELKTERGNLSALQRFHLGRLTALGQTCYVLRGKRSVDLYFDGELEPWR